MRTLTGRLSAWLVLLVAILAAGAVIGTSGAARTSNDPTATLPDGAESTRVAAVQRQLPSGQENPALVVYSRDGRPLTAADTTKITADAQQLRAAGPPVFSDRRDAATIVVPLSANLPADELISRVKQLREQARAGLPDGLTAQVTGGAGFSADIADSFTGANTNLLLVTVVVVALLLLITYRSPLLWLVPLAVVGMADRVASGLVAVLSRHTDLTIGDSTVGIVTVLVFGAGTDYALLLISRYREELHRHEDRREAMRRALRGAGPAVIASAATVVLSLLTLLLASLGDTVALGVTAALGIGVAALFALVVLPPALVVCGRGLFWPFIPRVGDELSHRLWSRVGTGVARRPGLVTALSLVVLAVCAAGIPGTRLGLSQTEQFRVQAESVDGLETLSRSFPAGAADPAVVIAAPAKAQEVLAAVSATPGVAQARIAEQTPTVVRIDAVLTAAPDTPESYQSIRTLRSAVHAVPGGDALVGGSVATALDNRDASRDDLKVIVPVILLVVLLVLGVLLRAVVAALLLITTVIASFAAALGAGSWLFRQVLDYPGLDNQVPLFSFLFLVALGVDYNIFLVTRAREEAAHRGTRDGMIQALAATGAVITSAGVLLAAVFAVLGVLPIITLTQIGVIVGLGVLLDTLLVRTVLVPALATLLGDRFWWPARPRPRGAAPEPDRVPAVTG
ncbi:efflux RND transporter permease subunit [Couchioplanes caeruleus]|uniref:MMPL family transporter n=1 Tax=Couchioplanes caeruleus TaxID=56438 RepID=UPI00201BDB15|nr:efflux RND transporter permease subunit [Couchioplanes caeruleus]UQU61401.1 efflux RND transporter permease subunit [Couchioplanes caeruleus]